jgi:PAS domain S-box-containing protein
LRAPESAHAAGALVIGTPVSGSSNGAPLPPARAGALEQAGLQATLDALDIGVIAVDERGIVAHCNITFRKVWQTGEATLVGAPFHRVMREMSQLIRDASGFQPASSEGLDPKIEPQHGELTLLNGQVVAYASAAREINGAAVGRVWTFRNVSAQRAQERRLRTETRIIERQAVTSTDALSRSEQLFEQLVAAVTDYAIFMLDPEGYVVSWNPGAERIKGYTNAEIVGQHFSRFYTPEDREAGMPQRTLQIAMTRGKFEGEGWRMRKDGSRFWANVLLDTIRDPQGTLLGFAKITRDMTEYRAMQEQLHQAQKMEAIGQLTGGVAHDFNNLLTVIIGNLDAIWRHLPVDEGRLRRAVDQASRGAQRAATLTQQLLAFARRQPLNPKPCDINRLVADMSELLSRTLGENIAVETVLAAGLWCVEVDAHQLESAILNLAVNSRDAMPDGGKLTIETANAHIDDNYTRNFGELRPGQYVAICVSDTGSGMTREVLSRAFDPFYTTKPIGQGTGLGLSQVYGFVKQSNGHIRLYSEAGHGTSAKIYLPRFFDAAPAEEEIERPATLPEARPGETILVVEDDDDVRIYSTESLRELKFNVLEASNAASALRVLDEHPEIKLLFTDVGLPGANGRELVDAALRRRPDLKVLFTTGYARNAIVHQGRLDAGVELLTKPFTRAQLAVRIREVLDMPAANGDERKVALVAEDEELVRMFLVENLEGLNFRIVHAPTSSDALVAAQSTPNIDVAIIDIGLPDRSGLDLARDLRARYPDLPLVIASGYGSGQLGSLSRDPRVAYLAKPYDEGAVASVLESLGLIRAKV